MNKSFNTFVVESGGYENLPFMEKDCRNYVDKVKRLKFGEGDAEAIRGYFTRVQYTDREFFYAWELEEENRIKSLFWVDAGCRAAYEEFGDVVTFDTTYLTNQYEMPKATFVGLNHHGQSILLGRASNAIITGQDQAMKNAIEVVFLDARHCEFEASWNTMLETYQLENNKWLIDLYAERQRWVPCFVKDIFWAGMSTTQRSESINSFFDKYLNKKTTLKQFVEQYENALRDRVEKENVEDFNSYNSWYPPITRYAMEEQMKHVLTNAKFKEFREELTGKMYCGVGSSKSEGGHIEYEVLEDVMDNESIIKKQFSVWFKKGDSHEECDIRCICRLFEFRGMLCRHALTVLINENIYLVPNKYILRRWRKDVKRRHTKVKVNYSDWVVLDVGRRYDKMCTAFSEVADLASELDEKCSLVLHRKLQDADLIGCGAEDGETMKKRSKKEKELVQGIIHRCLQHDDIHNGDHGISTTQRSESINSFFDKYLNKKTTLKDLVEQYENALRDRAEKENMEDFNSYNSWYPAITRYAMEEQMKNVLTNIKFKDFREELTGKMYCGIGSLNHKMKS
nr:protein FAR1-related sequence 5-like [Tanacetum cinerariifolium]